MSDYTASQRQGKRAQRLKEQGYKRKTIWVHEDCEKTFEQVKEYLQDPESANNLQELVNANFSKQRPVNIATVRHLSPFRYPGGKTWLVPEIKKRLKNRYLKPEYFIEPFAGGGITSLTVAAESLANEVIIGELDPYVSSVWKTILNNPEYLCEKILTFNVTLENVREVLETTPDNTEFMAFQTIIKNRMNRGGILAPGAGLVKSGENGKGLKSRWYPDTLVNRIRAIYQLRHRIHYYEQDAFELIQQFQNCSDSYFFIDPPYTFGKKRAGKRLYIYNEIDHPFLFRTISQVNGNFLMTYDDTEEAKSLASKYKFQIDMVPMKNTHHKVIYELLIHN